MDDDADENESTPPPAGAKLAEKLKSGSKKQLAKGTEIWRLPDDLVQFMNHLPRCIIMHYVFVCYYCMRWDSMDVAQTYSIDIPIS